MTKPIMEAMLNTKQRALRAQPVREIAARKRVQRAEQIVHAVEESHRNEAAAKRQQIERRNCSAMCSPIPTSTTMLSSPTRLRRSPRNSTSRAPRDVVGCWIGGHIVGPVSITKPSVRQGLGNWREFGYATGTRSCALPQQTRPKA